MDVIDIKNFYDDQLSKWPLAKTNCEALKTIEKKSFRAGDLNGIVQFNPARAVSTLAKVDKTSITQRKCFLCKENRPTEQVSIEIIKDWELLLNPYPILPYHFTIANKNHIPQVYDLQIGRKLASKLPGFVVFFNEDGAGASAPDHNHFQAVPLKELPLISLLENTQEILDNIDVPFKISFSEEEINNTFLPKNIYFWRKESEDDIKIIAIPRKQHRPRQYYLPFPEKRTISPGAIDMAGVIVTPCEEDFHSLNDKEIIDIYRQVGVVKKSNNDPE